MSTLTMTPPRIVHLPTGVSSAGQEAVDLARLAGLVLDPWQAYVLEHSLTERPDGRWAAFEVGLNVARQNGKGGVLEARELAGLFLLGERLIIHSAHQFDTSLEAFRRLLFLIEDTPELSRRVKRVSRAHGEEGIELTNGQRVRFRTRTKGGGRGFSGDCVILDEAMILPEATLGALMPTLSARPNPQLWYAGSAVDQAIHMDGIVWARVRQRAMAGEDTSLAYFEWSADAEHPSQVTPEMAADPATWRAANPAMDIRIEPDHIAKEMRSMDPRTFAVERLGVGDWPDTDPAKSSVIDWLVWSALADPDSSVDGAVAFAADVAPDRRTAAIAAAGLRPDGRIHIEIIEHRAGTGWLADRMRELRSRHACIGTRVDGASPAAGLAADLEAETATTGEYVAACGHFLDLVTEGGLAHLACPELDQAVRGAARRTVGDAWAFSRRSSQVDITPLVAATLAAHLVHQRGDAGLGITEDEMAAVFA